MGKTFYLATFLPQVNDNTELIVIFTAWIKIKYFYMYNARLAGFGEILV